MHGLIWFPAQTKLSTMATQPAAKLFKMKETLHSQILEDHHHVQLASFLLC